MPGSLMLKALRFQIPDACLQHRGRMAAPKLVQKAATWKWKRRPKA